MATKTRKTKSAVKRKVYTVAQKKRIVTGWKVAKKKGVTFRAWCAKNKVAESTVRNWIKVGYTGSTSATRSTMSKRRTTATNKTVRATRVKAKPKAKAKTKVKAKVKAKAKPKSKVKAKAKRTTRRW